MQTAFNFNTRQNSKENQEIYDHNKVTFGAQCQRIYDWLMTGKTLTRKEAEDFLDIGDARARIRDLRFHGINIEDKKAGNGNRQYKVYFINLAKQKSNLIR